jgi:phosphoglycerate kinase
MRSVSKLSNRRGKKVILRLDLNVPLNRGKITDSTRIDKVLPTIEFLLKQNSKIIILSHVGRPNGKVTGDLSLKPIQEDIEKKLNEKINLIEKNIYELKKDILDNFNEKILLIENIRFYPEEEKNDTNFAKYLASLGDIYVNDAFSCSHRAHASVCKISKFLPSFSGLQLDLEISALKKITSNITKPVTCIIGGSKISTKINIIKNLISKFDNMVIVGAMANNLIEYNGYNIGKSLKEENVNSIVSEILTYSKEKNCKIIFPEDVVVANDFKGQPKIKELNQIKLDEMILDIGPKTIESICNIINNTNTILWNGPAGYFENPNFANGSNEIAKKIIEKNIENKIFSVVGGGDTVSLINSLNAFKNFNFVSTAGGAFLEYLEGKELPGISALN